MTRAPSPRAAELAVFLGPSLPADEARALAPCRVLPPARAGDLYALLPERPLAIALVDGLFEGVPSVWHHEILAAQRAGVQVFGGGSMGALRAAELAPFGVIGVGRIFGWYRDGLVVDDAEVALIHAGPEHAYRRFSVPLVAVRAAAGAAVDAGLLRARDGRALVAAAAAIFYQERTWDGVLAAAPLAALARARLRAFLPGAPDPKAEDAREVVRAAAAYVRARRTGAPPPPPPAGAPPSHARRRQLEEARAGWRGTAVRTGDVLDRLAARADAGRLAAQGLRRALLAALARSLGLAAGDDRVDRAEAAWLAGVPGRLASRGAALAAAGLDAATARQLAEDLALERLLLEAADRVLPDGPSWREGLALGARITGAFGEELARLARGRAGAPPRGRRRVTRARASR